MRHENDSMKVSWPDTEDIGITKRALTIKSALHDAHVKTTNVYISLYGNYPMKEDGNANGNANESIESLLYDIQEMTLKINVQLEEILHRF